MTAPTFSVVIGLVSGKRDDLRSCLSALHAQTGALPTEILVPYDEPCADVITLGDEFPAVRFLRAEGLDTWKARAGGSREHHDALRTIGLRAAAGEIVALTEDHARVAPTWCAEMAAALERYPAAAAVGGAVECDSAFALSWAVWFCDFGRYQNPLPDDRSAFVSDSNVAYRRRALEHIARAWKDSYHETVVHQALNEAGFALYTTAHAVVWQQRGPLALGAALRERYVWARSFAGTRAYLLGPRRWTLAILSPLLPFVMTTRLARVTLARGRHIRRFLACLPLIVLLHAVWAFGEFVGYVTAHAK